jgi:hypothetical protein
MAHPKRSAWHSARLYTDVRLRYLHVVDVDVGVVGQRVGRREELVQHGALVVREHRGQREGAGDANHGHRQLLRQTRIQVTEEHILNVKRRLIKDKIVAMQHPAEC